MSECHSIHHSWGYGGVRCGWARGSIELCEGPTVAPAGARPGAAASMTRSSKSILTTVGKCLMLSGGSPQHLTVPQGTVGPARVWKGSVELRNEGPDFRPCGTPPSRTWDLFKSTGLVSHLLLQHEAGLETSATLTSWPHPQPPRHVIWFAIHGFPKLTAPVCFAAFRPF